MFNKKYDVEYSTSVESPHPSWVKPFSGGTLKAFFLPGVLFGREFMELAQRMDIDYETVTVEKNWDLNKWGIGEYYHIRGGIGDFRIAFQNMENALTSDQWFDVMVLPAVNGWGYFGQKMLEAIDDRVKKGAGLVMVKPFKGEGAGDMALFDELSPLSPLFNEGFAPSKTGGEGFPKIAFDKLMSDKWMPKPHYITSGIPFDLFPYDELAFYPYAARGEVIIESAGGLPIAAVQQYGRGRVVAFGWYPRNILPQHAKYQGDENFYDTIIDTMAGARHSLEFNYLEYFYGLIYRGMVWAAGREPEQRILTVGRRGETLQAAAKAPANATYRLRIADAYGNTVHEASSADEALALPPSLALGGSFHADVILEAQGKVADWHTVKLDYPELSTITDATPAAPLARTGDTLRGQFTVRGPRGELRIDVVDDFNRVLHRQTHIIAGAETVEWEWVVGSVPSIHVTVRGEVWVDGHLVCRRSITPVVVTPDHRTVDDFEIFMNSHNRGQGDLWALALKRSLELGITGTFPGSPKVLATSGAEGLGIYWYYRFPYVERKEAYLRSRDKKDLCRVPCLNDPEFWREMEEKMVPELARNKVYGPISYYANDEGSLTCYTNELDLCFCPHCMARMRAWLKTVYADLEVLNKSWGTAFEDWDAVMPHTFEEAEEDREFASWGDHRRFMELTFTGSYQKIKGIVQSVDAAGVIRMSGCQASTPYTGYDYYLLHQHVGYFEAYGGGNQFELHRSFARSSTIIGTWLGYGGKGVAIQHSLWTALLHGITLINVFCEFSMLNPDFTFFRGALDMREVFLELRRRGIGKLLLHTAKRDNLGIAIHYSMASIHGTYARHDFPRFNKSRQGWLNVLESGGWQYDFLASQQIEAGELTARGFKVLILPYSIALSAGETAAILEFAEQGGTVLADMQAGVMDEHCKRYHDGSLDKLFGIERLNHNLRPFSGDDVIFPIEDFEYPELNQDVLLEQEIEFPFAESGVRLAGGKAAFLDDFMRKIPVVVINRHGKGLGVYLNCTLEAYAEGAGEAGLVRNTIGRILTIAGAKKPVRLLTPEGDAIESGYETVYYGDGMARYVALLRDTDGQNKTLYDGRIMGGDGPAAAVGGGFVLTLDEPAHVYDARAGAYVGYTDRVETSVVAGDCKIFSLLPHRLGALSIGCPEAIRRGERIRFDIALVTDKACGEYANVLAIAVTDPAGEYQWIYSDNLSAQGRTATKECLIPCNEQTGIWKITVTDAATGMAAIKEFRVE